MAVHVYVHVRESLLQVEMRAVSQPASERFATSLTLEHSHHEISNFVSSFMVEKLGGRYSAAQIEIRAVCEQGRILFASRDYKAAEFLEIELAVVIFVVSSEQ